jgi:hypothetical protein
MRRVSVVLASLFAVVVLPSPAFAWWDFIEQFSGPEKFRGPDIQFRLFCNVETDKQVVSYTEPADQNRELPQIRVKTERESEFRTPSPVGMLLGVCPIRDDKKERTRMAFDLGVRFMWSGKYDGDTNAEFGNGHTIFFNTVEPTVVFPIAVKKSFRVEYAFGAGAYWFSSEGFDSFHGWFVEPARANVYIPLPQKYAFVFSVGALVFPGGFDATAFAGDASHNDRIAAEVVPVISIAADLTPAAKAWTEKLGLRW